MKKHEKEILKWITIAATIVAAFTILPRQALALNEGIALLVQQSPVQGGTVTPEMGVHKFTPGEQVVLTATPQRGYQFVCWIGDVSDMTSRRTAVYLNSPKIVIAVFERSRFEFLVTDELAQSQSGGGLFLSPADYSNQGYGGSPLAATSGNTGTHPSNNFPAPPNNETNDLPVPPPIPEPATILLLSLGCLGLGLVRKRRKFTN